MSIKTPEELAKKEQHQVKPFEYKVGDADQQKSAKDKEDKRIQQLDVDSNRKNESETPVEVKSQDEESVLPERHKNDQVLRVDKIMIAAREERLKEEEAIGASAFAGVKLHKRSDSEAVTDSPITPVQTTAD